MDDHTRSTAEAYDDVAEDFAGRTAQRSAMAAEFFGRFVAALAPRSIVADLGCGPGHDADRLANAGHCVMALDRSEGLLAVCGRQHHRTQADLRSLPFGIATLDAVWCSATLLHIERSQLVPTLAESDRALKPGGVIGLATSLGDDEGWELVPAGPNRRPEVGAERRRWFVHHRERDLRAALAEVGWEVRWSGVRESHRDWLQVLAFKPR